jgi:putative ABC transport system ATP-binding protein
MIRVRGMHKAYRTGKLVNEVLRGIDLDIQDGEMVSIMGPSGSGKSTLLHAIGGLDSDYSGEITVDGRDLHTLGDIELSAYRNRFVGFVFQAFYLLPHMTVLENVALPAVFARGDAALDDPAIRARALEVLDEVELGGRNDSRPTTLSGGQRQRVAVARALFNRPKLMLCDEPTGNLDSKLGAQILELFRRLNRTAKITVLIVTHDPKIAAATARRLQVVDGLLLDEGGERRAPDHETVEDDEVVPALAERPAREESHP